MITYHNRTRMTAVPTKLLQDVRLSVEAKGFAAILYALGDEGVELSELACHLNMPEERIFNVLKELAAAVSRAASNINQICRRINSTSHVYEDDVAELKAQQTEIWELLKMRQRDEL